MKKVCFILNDSNTKGANGAFIELINSLDRTRIDPYVILPSLGPMIYELRDRSIPFKIFYYKWWAKEKESPKWKKLARIIVNFAILPVICYQIIKWRCDIIYTNSIAVGVGLFGAIITKKTHIFHIHEFVHKNQNLVFDFGETISLWLANKFTKYFICVSFTVSEEYPKFIEKTKRKVIYQSVTISDNDILANDNFDNIRKHEFQCVIVGRLYENKGQVDAIKAINILTKEMRLDVGLWIVGTGNKKYNRYLKDMVKRKNLENFVTFLGYLDNPFPFVQKADVALMCSKFEAFGRVTVEAMLLGKPVIGGKSGTTAELIKSGFNGLLYKQGCPKDLAEKIDFCIKNSSLVHQMGINARKWAIKQFNQKDYVEKVSALLESEH